MSDPSVQRDRIIRLNRLGHTPTVETGWRWKIFHINIGQELVASDASPGFWSVSNGGTINNPSYFDVKVAFSAALGSYAIEWRTDQLVPPPDIGYRRFFARFEVVNPTGPKPGPC